MENFVMNKLMMIVFLFIICGFIIDNGMAEEADNITSKLENIMKEFDAGKTKEAFKKMDIILDQHPRNPSALILRARMYDKVDSFQKAVEDYTALLKIMPETFNVYHWRGVCYFNLGKFKKSVEDFDQYIRKNPKREAGHWQRGISHYYAKMYSEGRKQFEVHQTVNSQDVENSVWHFLCVTRDESIGAARKELIEIQADTRIPMMKVHELFRDVATVEDVLKKAEQGSGKISEEKLRMQRFYAHLYIGLYYESHQKMELAKKHIHLAATKYSVSGYMGNVARVHDREFQKQDKKE
jgi:lipoprotein NlpI